MHVNGETSFIGQKADPEVDEITVDGRPLTQEGQKRYLMLNKPRGYVCTLSDEKGRKTVAELVKDCGERVYPVGRLDLDSEGLLLLTNDGEWMQHLLHPRYEVNKVYEVSVAGEVRGAAEALASMTQLDGEPIRPAQVRVLRQGRTPLFSPSPSMKEKTGRSGACVPPPDYTSSASSACRSTRSNSGLFPSARGAI